MLTIDVRNPVDGSSSARKLLRRTPRNSTRRSNSKDHSSSNIFKGGYLKMLKNVSTNSILNQTSFNSQLNSRT